MDDSSSELAGALAALTSCINAPPEPSTFQAVADALANTCRILGNCDAIAASQTPLALLQQAVQLLSQTCLALHQNVSTGWFNPDLASLPVWDSHFLPMLDVCFFSDRWHQHALAADPSPTKDGYQLLQAGLRDLLKDAYLPLVCEALARSATLSLHTHLAALLAMAHTAAEVIGWRDPRVLANRTLRNYGLVNALWMGVLRCWTAVPHELRPELTLHGLDAANIAEKLVHYLETDAQMLCTRREAADVKLLQFWLLQAGKLGAEYPDSCASILFQRVATWEAGFRRLLTQSPGDTDARAASVVQGVAAGALWVRSARLQVQCLNALGGAALDTAMAAACSALAAGGPEAGHVLDTALGLLTQAGPMSPGTLAAGVPLLAAAFEAALTLPTGDAFANADLRQQLVDATMGFALACAAAAAAAAAAADPHLPSPKQSAWTQCQLCLLQLSLRPHPLLAAVLPRIWAGLAAMCDEAAAGQLIAAVHTLLQRAATAQAVEYSYRPPSPAVAQLEGLLAALLSSAPDGAADAFFTQHLRLSGADDRCDLAHKAAIVRAAALVDGTAGTTRCLDHVMRLSSYLCISVVVKTADPDCAHMMGPHPASDPVHAAWAMGCQNACLEYITSVKQGVGHGEVAVQVAREAAHKAVSLCVAGQVLPTARDAACMVPALGVLCAAHRVDVSCLSEACLTALLPVIDGCHRFPTLHARVAALAAAFKAISLPPACTYAILLEAADPVVLHEALQSYVDYIRGCGRANMLAVLPASMKGAGTEAMDAPAKALISQYLYRAPDQGFAGASPGQLAGWAGPLTQASRKNVPSVPAATCHPEALAPGGWEVAEAGVAVAEAAVRDLQRALHVVEEWHRAGGSLRHPAAATLADCRARMAGLVP